MQYNGQYALANGHCSLLWLAAARSYDTAMQLTHYPSAMPVQLCNDCPLPDILTDLASQ